MTTQTPPPLSGNLLSTRELARKLGPGFSPGKVSKMAARGALPAPIWLGHRAYFDADEVAAKLDQLRSARTKGAAA